MKVNCEEETPSLWKTIFSVEPVFPKEMILSCHTLNTHGLVKQGEAPIKNKEALGKDLFSQPFSTEDDKE